MPRLAKRITEERDPYILMMFNDEVPADDIGKMFNLTTSAVYEIIKNQKLRVEQDN